MKVRFNQLSYNSFEKRMSSSVKEGTVPSRHGIYDFNVTVCVCVCGGGGGAPSPTVKSL